MKHSFLIIAVILLGYFSTRLVSLTSLPVFADEAIYIRWAQMIRNESEKNLFLPLYDGKTPLHMWLLIPFLSIFPHDPLLSSRLLSVFMGLVSLSVVVLIVRELDGDQKAQIIAAVLYLLIPFTFLYDRMALIDSSLTAFLAASTYWTLKLKRTGKWKEAILAGAALGLAILTKLPALFFAPILLLLIWSFPKPMKLSQLRKWLAKGMFIFIIAGLLFASLRVSELFPFLFQRGSDFTFSVSEWLGGGWQYVLGKLPRYGVWLVWYLTISVFVIPIAYIWQMRKGKRQWLPLWLTVLGLGYALPFMLMGKIVFSRYLLPSVVLVIPAAALMARHILRRNQKAFWVITLAFFIQAGWFMVPLLMNPDTAHFPVEDQQQYLTVWSSGHGIVAVKNYLMERAKHARVEVATEGFFGTLPDGLLMYFDRSKAIEQMAIFGVGVPIAGVPEDFRNAKATAERYIVANEDRITFDYTSCCEVVLSTARPFGGAPLLLLKVNQE